MKRSCICLAARVCKKSEISAMSEDLLKSRYLQSSYFLNERVNFFKLLMVTKISINLQTAHSGFIGKSVSFMEVVFLSNMLPVKSDFQVPAPS